MRTLFRSIYDKMIQWSGHKKAPYYLAGVSFIESSVFPIPPDVMLIPMVISRPMKAWEYAFITTLFSILGGLLGYAIGYFAFEWIAEPFITMMGYEASYNKVVKWFAEYGIWIIIAGGFTPHSIQNIYHCGWNDGNVFISFSDWLLHWSCPAIFFW